MKTYQIALAANAMVDLPVTGSKLVVRSTTGAIDIRDGAGAINMSAMLTGDGCEGIPFTLLFVTNTTGSAITVELVVSEGEFTSRRVFMTGEVGVTASSTLTYSKVTVGTVATTIPAVAGQKKITFRCDLANGGKVTNGTASGTGPFYMAGEGDEVATSAAIDLIADTAGQVVHYRQES